MVMVELRHLPLGHERRQTLCRMPAQGAGVTRTISVEDTMVEGIHDSGERVSAMEPVRSRRILRTGWWRALPRSLALLTLALLGSSCKNLNVFSLSDDSRLGAEAYNAALGGAARITHGPAWRQVKRVTDRLLAAARERDPEVAEAFAWEVRLLDDDETINAYCLPGGKMAVYTGILSVAGDDPGLATVLGHEIAHATLRHGTEQLTRSLGLEVVLAMAMGEGDEETVRVATNLLLTLPHGREAELEADRRGLFYMAAAGYDPRAAVGFWSSMSSLGGQAPPEFLSTHPSDDRRIRALEEALPEALALWESALSFSPCIPQTTAIATVMVFLRVLNPISDGTFAGRLPA